MPDQLVLRIPIPADVGLTHVIGQDRLDVVVPALKNWMMHQGARIIYIYGAAGSGKTFLLHSVAAELMSMVAQDQWMFLALGQPGLAPDLLDNLEMPWLILDDLHKVFGSRHWEEQLFHRFQANTGQFWLVSASELPHALCSLPDLRSRLMSGLVFAVDHLSDADLSDFLGKMAQARGMTLESAHKDYILQRVARTPQMMMQVVEALDEETLRRQVLLNWSALRQVLERIKNEEDSSINKIQQNPDQQ